MKKEEYDRLLEAELNWIPKGSECFQTFWLDGFTHIVISKKPNGKYQILRSWMMNEPGISVDMENGTLEDVLSYVLRKLLDKQPKMEIEA